jgi:transposase InsO family protein
MVIHKRTRLTPIQRREVYEAYHQKNQKVSELAASYHVSRPTIYKILQRGRKQDFTIHSSRNKRFACLRYGIKRLSKIEKQIEERLKKQAKRYNKDYPGQMVHGDTKRLPLLEGQKSLDRREYLFVAIDDFSRELYAAILPDKTQNSAKDFLEQVLEECPYIIEQFYTDNGKEYRGDPEHHAFMKLCRENSIEQRFTRVKTPKTNGKAERVIKTIMELWHNKNRFRSSAHRKTELKRFINYYNGVKPHKGINGLTPEEKLIEYFYPDKL